MFKIAYLIQSAKKSINAERYLGHIDINNAGVSACSPIPWLLFIYHRNYYEEAIFRQIWLAGSNPTCPQVSGCLPSNRMSFHDDKH